VNIEDLPEVYAFFNTNKPAKDKQKTSQKPVEPDNHPDKSDKKEKTIKKVFDEIVVKY
jgi:hypothetical protein